MFGLVNVNWNELTQPQQDRYRSVYCGICREIHIRSGQMARITLRYDMAFLALLLMSLYEPEEAAGTHRCVMHPLTKRSWLDNEAIRYAADMNVALAYYKALDDDQDDGKTSAKLLCSLLEEPYRQIAQRWPRQCSTIQRCIQELSALEQSRDPNPDSTASCFGKLMAELMVFREDLWEADLRELGFSLGRFLYLADAVLDYKIDRKSGSYNPFLASGQAKNPALWEEYLLLDMGRCTRHYENLPLVQDKALLDNILYSGVWVQYRRKTGKEDSHGR